MHKRLGLLIIVLLLLPSAVFAQATSSGLIEMAKYFPSDTVVFGAVRTDEDFLNGLDALWSSAANTAQSAGTSMPGLRDSLNIGLASAGTDVDSIMAWLGDYAAFGGNSSMMLPEGAPPDSLYFVIEVDDRAAAEAFAESLLKNGSTSAEQGDFTVITPTAKNEIAFAISDDLMVMYSPEAAMPHLTREARLDTNIDFQNVVNALPNDQYNLFVYIDPRPMIQNMPASPNQPFTIEAAPLGVGFTILADNSYVIDSAQLPLSGAVLNPLESIDPNFARFIPGDSSAVVQATNLSALYTSAIGFLDLMNSSTESSTVSASAQIEQVLTAFGFDLQDDLLSWMTGDYALFLRSDLTNLLADLAMNNSPDLSTLAQKIDMGLVIEATDPVKAKTFATKLSAVLQQMLAGQSGVTLSSETISGVDTTVINVQIPIDPQTSLNLDILLGVTDNVFFLATRQAAERIISGDGMLTSNSGYIEAGTHTLPNPTSIWYADGSGLIVGVGGGTIFGLALMGPAIGNVFNNIVANLQEEGGGTTVVPTAVPTNEPAPAVDPTVVIDQLKASIAALTSSSISSTVTDEGITLLRFVITVHPQ